MPLSLDGVKVVAFETSVSGPMCSVLLSDYGAEVIKIETPKRGDIARYWDTVANGLSGYFVSLNRNKKSVELDVRTDEGKKELLRLVKDADVFIENHRHESIERLGLTYGDLRKINDRLIYCGISGYGKSGPSANEPAYDLLIQAESGLMSLTGYPDKPAKIGISLCDLLTGIYSALAISLALRQRDKTGKGCEIEMSMFDCAVSLLMAAPMYYWYRGKVPGRHGTKHSMIAPAGLYLAKDNKYVAIAVERDEDWEKFCVRVLHDRELAQDPRFKTNEGRLRNRPRLEKILDSAFILRSQKAWLGMLKPAGIAAGRLNDIGEVVGHPQVVSRKLSKQVSTEVGPVRFIGNPIRISDQNQLLKPVPALGQSNKEFLKSGGRPQRD